MKKGFYTIMSAQFFSSLADNALFVAAVELLRSSGQAEWQRAALVPMSPAPVMRIFILLFLLVLLHAHIRQALEHCQTG